MFMKYWKFKKIRKAKIRQMRVKYKEKRFM